MSLINEKVLEKFSAWAKEREDRHIFPEISKEETSYFVDRELEETYIMEYSFKTLAELRSGLEKYSGFSAEPRTLKMLTVEICQDRFKRSLKMNENQDNCHINAKENDKESISEYIYIF